MNLDLSAVLNENKAGAIGILWTDLETTGAEEDKDDIIEIGAIYTDFKLQTPNNSAMGWQTVVEPTEAALGRMVKNNIVRNMHTENGLLDECIGSPTRAPSIRAAEMEMINWLDRTINYSTTKGPVRKFRFMLAGSGVGHFDRRFIRRHMPILDSLLVFSPLDVGNVRRLAKFAGFEPSTVPSQDTKNHRALDDIRLHLQEAQAYFDLFKKFSELYGTCNVCKGEGANCAPDPKHEGWWFCSIGPARKNVGPVRVSGRSTGHNHQGGEGCSRDCPGYAPTMHGGTTPKPDKMPDDDPRAGKASAVSDGKKQQYY